MAPEMTQEELAGELLAAYKADRFHELEQRYPMVPYTVRHFAGSPMWEVGLETSPGSFEVLQNYLVEEKANDLARRLNTARAGATNPDHS